jgi:hypothetical protein
VPAALTAAEARQAAAADDPRLAKAVAMAEGGRVIQFLAGAPELVSRYETAPPAERALLDAAVDARRLGMGTALPLSFLAGAAPGYIADADWDALGGDWLEEALDAARAPARGVRGPLAPDRPRLGAPARDTLRLADYLEQHGRRTRRTCLPPDGFWVAAACHARPGDLPALADAAEARGLLLDAARLRKHATLHGSAAAAYALVEQCHALHPADLRPAQWAARHAFPDPPGRRRQPASRSAASGR